MGDSVTINSLIFVTTTLKVFKDNHFVCIATGFFYKCKLSDVEKLFLITNKHVVIQPENYCPNRVVIRLHRKSEFLQDNDDYEIKLYKDNNIKVWLEHENKEVDIILIELDKDELEKKYSFKALSKENFAPKDLFLDLGSDVIVIGYPLGFHDTFHNLPIVRTANIASIFPIPFQDKPYVLIDGKLHPGMSGSPIMTKPANIFNTASGTIFEANPVSFFLGIHSSSYKDIELHTLWFASLIEDIITKNLI